MITPIFKIKIKDGKISFYDSNKYENYLTSLYPGDYELLIRKPKKTRSSRANRYYWGVVLKLISEHTGEHPEDLHNHFSYKHLRFTGRSGKLISRRSTTSLTKQEFHEYTEKIIIWAGTYLGITFPDPESVELDFIVY